MLLESYEKLPHMQTWVLVWGIFLGRSRTTFLGVLVTA